jgi:hypothetical protein
MAVLLVACAPSATGSVAPTVGPSPSPDDDRLFGAIVGIDPRALTVEVDLAQFFGLEDGIAAAREDGVIGPNDDLPNPFYVRNLHERRTLGITADATVIVLGYDAEGNTLMTPISLEEFVLFWKTGPASGTWTAALYYWFSPADDVIDRIEAQYIP